MNAVALAARDRKLRGELARYLEGAGFEVDELDAPARPDRRRALVWLTEHDDDPRAIVTTTIAWLDANARRVVVVAWKPVALRELREANPARLAVLPPPVFGWQVVDALRAPGVIE